MSGIMIMAPIVVVLGLVLSALALNSLSKRRNRYLWLVVAGLPLSFLINKLVKIPFLHLIGSLTGVPLAVNASAPVWFILLVLFNSPVWEEAVKVLPLAIPGLRRLIKDPVDGLCVGLALGMGFGIGEAIYLAYGIAITPMYSAIPWYAFTGYAFERLLMVFGHGFMTAQTTHGFQRGGWHRLAGYLTAVGLHALVNFGPLMVAVIPSIAQISVLLSYAMVPLMFVLFQRQLKSARKQVAAETGIEEEKIFYEKKATQQ